LQGAVKVGLLELEMWLDISRPCPSSPCERTRAATGVGGEVFGGSHPRLGTRRGRPAVAAATLGARTSSPAASVRAAAYWATSYVTRGAGGSRAASSPRPTARGRAASSSTPVDRPDARTPSGGKTKTSLGDLGGRRSPFACQHRGEPAREGICRRQDRDGEALGSRGGHARNGIGDWGGWPSTGPGTSWDWGGWTARMRSVGCWVHWLDWGGRISSRDCRRLLIFENQQGIN
jgi:hypothetical protein